MTKLSRSVALGFFLLLGTAGCGGDSDSKASPDGGGTPKADGGTTTTGSKAVLGGFTVSLNEAVTTPGAENPAYTSLVGKVYDGESPPNQIWTVGEEAGGCKLLIPKTPFCNPKCGSSAACVDDNKCVSYPTAQNVGTVHVKGVGTAEFDLTAINNTYQPSGDVKLPYPPAPEGSVVRFSSTSGAVGAFTVESKGIAPLALPAGATFPVVSGKALSLKWTAAAQSTASRILVGLDISHHGGVKGKIECDLPDNGSADIPASQITKLLNLGVAGFPTIKISRESRGTVDVTGGSLVLSISSGVEREVLIEGLKSCTSDDDCGGKTCQGDLTCSK